LFPEKFEGRLDALFKIKEKWTFNEIIPFMNDINVGNLQEKLAKYCKIIPETNPFDNRKQVAFYYLKIKLY
jgi:hypothetical protein